MSSFQDLLKSRNTVKKKKKPNFIRQDSHKKSRLEKKWRTPRGLHSKIRIGKRGHRKKNQVGYKSPKAVHGLHPKGLKIKLISSPKEIKGIDKEKEGVIIAASVGLKKKIELTKKTVEQGITILNIKDPNFFLKNIEDMLKKRKEEKQKKKQVKEKKVKEKEKKAKKKGEKEEKEELAEKIEKEEKEKEKKEKDKLLTKRV